MRLCRFHEGFWRLWWKMWWFMYVYVISPGFLHDLGVKFGDFDVFMKTPRFSVCFQTISDRISLEITAQMRFAGKLTSILHRCPCAFLSFNMWRPRVYDQTPRFSWCFDNVIASNFCNYLAHLRLEGQFPFHRRRPLRVICLSKSIDPRVYSKTPRFSWSFDKIIA